MESWWLIFWWCYYGLGMLGIIATAALGAKLGKKWAIWLAVFEFCAGIPLLLLMGQVDLPAWAWLLPPLLPWPLLPCVFRKTAANS